jgi:ubiquinone/menaquinone biosynthesis C-methylase UbiE
MRRIPEPELMDSEAQASAYAGADFSESNALFTDQFLERFHQPGSTGRLADLGCGPADICIRLCRALPGWRITGLDAGPNMLRHAALAVAGAGLEQRIELRLSHLPDPELPARSFQAVTSNSLLHHLPEPGVLWSTIQQIAAPGAAVQVMDLRRPADEDAAAELVDTYAADAPQVLKDDFYHSLLAAYTPDEVARQLQEHGLGLLEISLPSDRHWLAAGRLPG